MPILPPPSPDPAFSLPQGVLEASTPEARLRKVLGVMVVLGLLLLAGWMLATVADQPGWWRALPLLAAQAWQAPLESAEALRRSWQGLPGLPLAAALGLLLFVWSGTGIPGCSFVLLAVGARFGPMEGTLLVTLATGLGCWPAFALARRWRRPARSGRAAALLDRLDALFLRHGPPVLLALRVVPLLPYQLLNPLLGLSRLRTLPYLGWSLLGVLPGSWVYVQAGATLGQAQDARGLLDPVLLGGGLAFAGLAWAAQRWWRRAGEGLG